MTETRVQTDCISFREVPDTSHLFIEYLSGSPAALLFYAPPAPLAQPVAQHSPEHRALIADILRDQNESFGASPATISNIERLRSGAHAIVTGQQVGIVGGPLLAIFKTISAIRIAQQHGAVPVFWLATTDHDIAEVDHASFVCDGRLDRITAELSVRPGDIAGHATVVSDLLAELDRCLPQADGEMRAWIGEAYEPGASLGLAFAKLWSRLFADHGLVVLDPDDARWPTAPILHAAAQDALELNAALRERAKELTDSGFHEQVLVTPATTLLFASIDGVRTPIRIHRELTGEAIFKAGPHTWRSAAELASWVGANAALVTPNALLRPVLQDHLLPTLAYVGGPAELAYFAQSSVVYRHLLGAATPVLPRASATLLEPRIVQLLKKYALRLPDLFAFHSEADLALELSRRTQPADISSTFLEERVRLGQSLEALSAQLLREDPTLKEAAGTTFRKMEYQLQKLESRSARARLRRESEIGRHAQIVWNNLRPKQSLQEREIAAAYYLLKYGKSLVPLLFERLSGSCSGHQMLPI